MKVEKMEVLGITVTDLDKAVDLFSKLFNTEFKTFDLGTEVPVKQFPADMADAAILPAGRTRIAIDPTGYFELIEPNPKAAKDGFRNVHFKVDDLEQAIAHFRAQGVRLISNIQLGTLREAIFHPDDLHGIRLCLVQYTEPSLIEAVLEKSDA